MRKVIPNTAATKHYITEEKLLICNKVQNTLNSYVALADRRIMSPTKKAILPISGKLTRDTKISYSFNNLRSGSLISISQLCNNYWVAIFSKYDAKIMKNNKIIIWGRRTDNRLWKIPMSESYTPLSNSDITVNTVPHVANSVIKLDSTKGELTKYYAATLFNPEKLTMLWAIHNSHLTSWLALSTKMICKHLSKVLATVQGHLDQEF